MIWLVLLLLVLQVVTLFGMLVQQNALGMILLKVRVAEQQVHLILKLTKEAEWQRHAEVPDASEDR